MRIFYTKITLCVIYQYIFLEGENIKCPGNLVKLDCLEKCPAACPIYRNHPCLQGKCEPGCGCPDGLILLTADTCVEESYEICGYTFDSNANSALRSILGK